MEDASSFHDSSISASSDYSESSFRLLTPKKNLETSVLKSRSNSKRSEAVVVEDVLSLNGDQCSGEGSETASVKKQKDRGSECSHKVIEKRRRDRINTSLGELSQLLPAQSNGKQGSGKLEKAEILELTVEYLKALQGRLTEKQEQAVKTEDDLKETGGAVKDKSDAEPKPVDHFGGYKDCTEEVFRFLVNVEAMDMQQPCFQRLMAHLRHQIQLLAESNTEVLKSKGKINMEGGKRTASKRSFQGNVSSSSSSSSSMGGQSGSGSGGKVKRARLHAHHSSSNKVQSSSSNGNSTSASSDNENSSDNARETQSDSAICLDDDLAEISGSSPKEDENGNRTNGSSVSSATNSRNGNETGTSGPSIPSMLLQGGNIPLRAPFLAPPCAIPTYALHPAGTHYIPIVLHPSVPIPPTPTFNGTGQLPFGMMPPASGGGFGMPSQLPFGFPFPYVPPGIPPYGYQASPMGFPFFNGLRKDLAGQGTTDPGNADSGSNGDDSSIEMRISPESSANQTDTSPSNSEVESSNTDEGGS